MITPPLPPGDDDDDDEDDADDKLMMKAGDGRADKHFRSPGFTAGARMMTMMITMIRVMVGD